MPETIKKATRRPAKTPKAKTQAQGSPTPEEVWVAPKKNPLGAPTTFNSHIGTVICIRIAEGESLRQILKDEGMPAQSTVYEWLLRHPSFAEQYTRAREEQADTLADEIIAIADESPEIDQIRDKEGNVVDLKIDSGYVAYQKQRIEARKWTAMKLKPKKYGDRVALEGVEGGAAIKTEDTNANKFLDIIKNMEMTKRAG